MSDPRAQAYAELESGKFDRDLWERALAAGNEDPGSAQEIYIRHRVRQMQARMVESSLPSCSPIDWSGRAVPSPWLKGEEPGKKPGRRGGLVLFLVIVVICLVGVAGGILLTRYFQSETDLQELARQAEMEAQEAEQIAAGLAIVEALKKKQALRRAGLAIVPPAHWEIDDNPSGENIWSATLSDPELGFGLLTVNLETGPHLLELALEEYREGLLAERDRRLPPEKLKEMKVQSVEGPVNEIILGGYRTLAQVTHVNSENGRPVGLEEFLTIVEDRAYRLQILTYPDFLDHPSMQEDRQVILDSIRFLSPES